jgi:hypothetical protein
MHMRVIVMSETQMGGGRPEGIRGEQRQCKLTDTEIGNEDARSQSRDAKACRAHLADLIRFHSIARKSHAGDRLRPWRCL